ncbi:hypothetical protein HanRHA438_Chr10g0446701 [Helianthus annuus]|nr:hypothetical protein HanRHA438_Chr10g0446701 [Helianthus annuus]
MALASFSAVVLIFRISIEIFYIYYVQPGHFLVPMSFGPGTFNGQDPPLLGARRKKSVGFLRKAHIEEKKYKRYVML